MQKGLRLISVILAILAPTSCSLPQAYQGPRLPDSQVATIRGYSTVCFGALQITAFDGNFSGYRFQAKPGPHHMKIRYWGEPFLPEPGPQESSYAICNFLSEFEVSFDTQANRTYSFDLREDPERGHSLSVSESNNAREIDSHPIPAKVERTLFKRRCTLSSYYYECFDW